MSRSLELRRWLLESLRSGTYASLAMIPFGLLFRALDLRVGHYGKKLVDVIFGELSLPVFRAVLLAEHLVIGWVSAAPLLWLLFATRERFPALLCGALYGAAYYVLLNSLALPLAFGDPLPWQLGWSTIYPSLIVHIVFGLVVAATARRFIVENGQAHRPVLDRPEA